MSYNPWHALERKVAPAKWFQCSNKNGRNKKFEVDLPPNQANPFML